MMIALQRSLLNKGLIPCQRLLYTTSLQTSHIISSSSSPPSIHQFSSSSKNNNHNINNTTPPQRKRLDIAIVGLPNAGKSQLLNSLTGTKVAAVSRKRHTTRSGILAARTISNTQLVFVDTPGFMSHESTAQEGVRQLAANASSEMDEVDYVLLVVDGAKRMEMNVKRAIVMLMFLALRSRGRREGGKSVSAIDVLKEEQAKFAVVINKVDLVSPKEKLLVTAGEVGSMADCCIRLLLKQRRSSSKAKLGDLVNHVLEKHTEEQGFDGVHDEDVELFAALTPEFHFTSAITNDDEGVDDVLGMLLDRATPTNDEWIVDADEEGNTNSIMTPAEIVEEILREKIYRCLHREVPHNVSQQNKLFRYATVGKSEEEKRVLHICQDLVVRTKSHQKLVLGNGGKTLQRIKETALKDLEQVFECEVDLELNVKFTKSTREVPLEAESLGALGRLID